MHSGIKEIFDDECSHVKIDQAFYRKICELEASFVNKKQDHIEFFGGTLTGVHVVRFTTEDFDKLFTDILETDEAILEERIHQLPDINPEFKISSNIFNIACIWIMHAIDNSHYLDKQQKHEGKIRICLYLNYRFLTSILFRYFKFPANPETAAATYAQLSYKYLLKAKGSWGAALRSRSEDVIDEQSIHFKTIKYLNDDYAVVRMLNDVQGRIKDMVKNIYSVFIQVHEKGSRISSSTAFIETDGELILKDKTKNIGVYTRYIRTVIPDKNSFIRQELFSIISNIMTTMPPRFLEQTLEWTSKNYSYIKDNTIEKAVDLIMEHAFQYLAAHRNLLKHRDDVASILSKLRGAYISSRSTEPKLMEIKEIVEQLVREATRSKNESVIAATRTGFCLYVILRAFTMQHYTSR